MPIRTRGMAVPVGVDNSGGAKINSAASHFNQTLMLAFSEGGDKNPFQDLGLKRVVFELDSHAGRARLLKRVQNIARKFSDRIELDQDNPVQVIAREDGEVTLKVLYVDLATNEPGEFQTDFSSAGTGL